MFERELLKLRQEKEVMVVDWIESQRLIHENDLLRESKTKTIDEYRDLVKKYEERIAEKDAKVWVRKRWIRNSFKSAKHFAKRRMRIRKTGLRCFNTRSNSSNKRF